jgi:hypothetical protein
MYNPESKFEIPASARLYGETLDLVRDAVDIYTELEPRSAAQELDGGTPGSATVVGFGNLDLHNRKPPQELNLPTLGVDSAELSQVHFGKVGHHREKNPLEHNLAEHDFIFVEMYLYADGKPFIAEQDEEIEGRLSDNSHNYTVVLGRERPPLLIQTFDPRYQLRGKTEDLDSEMLSRLNGPRLGEIDCEHLLTFLKEEMQHPNNLIG